RHVYLSAPFFARAGEQPLRRDLVRPYDVAYPGIGQVNVAIFVAGDAPQEIALAAHGVGARLRPQVFVETLRADCVMAYRKTGAVGVAFDRPFVLARPVTGKRGTGEPEFGGLHPGRCVGWKL